MSIIAVNAFKDNYIWCLAHPDQDTFTCVDPGDALPVIAFANEHQLTLQNVLLTHHHADHVAGVKLLTAQFENCAVFGPVDTRLPFVTNAVGQGDSVSLQDYSFQVLSIPGHTSSHIGYYEPNQGLVFTGDTLFSAGCGRVFDGTMEQLHQAITLLKNLPEATEVYCGHEYTLHNLQFAQTVEPHNADIQTYIQHLVDNQTRCTLPSSIGQEQKINPFMRTDQQAIKDYGTSKGLKTTDSLSLFRLLRQEKDVF